MAPSTVRKAQPVTTLAKDIAMAKVADSGLMIWDTKRTRGGDGSLLTEAGPVSNA
jgi:hypothetical protein